MQLNPNSIFSEVIEITPDKFEDERGYFFRVYEDNKDLADYIGKIVNINRSYNINKGTVRGLHFQHQPHGETKMVTCVRGAIYDVAMDVREESKTFGEHIGVTLSERNGKSLIVPKGFAHGFMTLMDDTEVIYFTDEHYYPAREGTVSLFTIDWPIDSTIISSKDKNYIYIENDDFIPY